MKMHDYEYDGPIQSDQLRILTLSPSPNFDDDIKCSLRTVNRSTTPVYTALSYSWRSEEEKIEEEKVKTLKASGIEAPEVRPKLLDITIDGGRFGVRENLESALRHLRLPHHARDLWIDAICILQDRSNDASLRDKAAQLITMDETYSNADEVIVWLGEHNLDEYSPLAVEALDVIGAFLEDLVPAAVPQMNLVLPMILNEEPEIYAFSMLKLLQRDWFSRLWVVQEVCLAPRATKLMVGKSQISLWKLFYLQIHPAMSALGLSVAASQVRSQDRAMSFARGLEPPLGLTRQYFMDDTRGVRPFHQRRVTLLSHLWNFRNRACTEASDRVFALIGISQDIRKADFHVYPGTDADVAFTSAARAIIDTHKKLDVLSMCHGIDDQTSRPSWVPNFRADPLMRPFLSLTVYDHSTPYFAATSGSDISDAFQEEQTVLSVKGYLVGTIKALGNDGKMLPQAALLHARSLVENLSTAGIAKDDDIIEAFWRTLISGRSSEKRLATNEIEGEQFKQWWPMALRPFPASLVELATVQNYHSAFIQHCLSRNFFVTENGYMGMCGHPGRVGDIVSLLPGRQVPLLLRQKGEKYQVVGECYVHGVMNGKLWEEKVGERQDICLI